MPYPNQHAARLKSPDGYKTFRTITPDSFPEGLSVIIGIKPDGKSEFQAIRADRQSFTFGEFKEWLREHGYTPMKIEEATAKSMELPMSDTIELFSTWSPVEINKSEDSRAKIGGIISTEVVDQQGDVILQDGMDFSYFLQRGWFNYEHKQGAANIVGCPSSVKPVMVDGKKATRVEGYLMTDKPLARDLLNTAKAISKAKLPRELGFSVEGQVLSRDKDNPKIITRAKILNVAITSAPVNPDARLELLARSLMAGDNMDGAKSPHSIAADALSCHPELRNPEVMAALHDMIGKSEVGYQQPAQPADDGLSNLVPSSVDEEVSVATAPASKSSCDDDYSMERAMYDRMKDEMSKMMNERMDEMIASLKGENKAMPNISIRQLQDVVGRVFPHLSAGQARTLATNLVSRAKTKYNP